jgi:hypothetical protein
VVLGSTLGVSRSRSDAAGGIDARAANWTIWQPGRRLDVLRRRPGRAALFRSPGRQYQAGAGAPGGGLVKARARRGERRTGAA